MPATTPVRFPFALPGRYRPLLLPFGVVPRTAWVALDDHSFTVRFGFWRLRTRVENLAGAETTGPYSLPKVLGPRLSLADRGITFGTHTDPGVCVRFHQPVPAADPLGLLRHPAVTVTVAQPDALVAAVRARLGEDAPGR